VEASSTIQLAVVGGGPAGLRAAEVAASAGVQVELFDAKPSIGRKFLVAGRGGLNLSHSENIESFLGRYSGSMKDVDVWRSLLKDFSPADSVAWARELGIETFTARNGRIYPLEMKAAPLLRRWQERLRALGVQFSMKHRLTKLAPGTPHRLAFENGRTVSASAVVFALGGASWPQTGSDGAWTTSFDHLGIHIHPLEPANCGWECPWPAEVLALAEGKPLKNLRVRAGDETVDGELLITRYGLEGGAIYHLGRQLRMMEAPNLIMDFKPSFHSEELLAKLLQTNKQETLMERAKQAWKLSDGAYALLRSREVSDPREFAYLAKSFPISLAGPRPLAEAISSAGGIDWGELDETLMLKRYSGLFAAGEMLDWEAPTGGYLMQGCLATGTRAGKGAAAWLRSFRPS
jgi:hypothetical protein